MTTPTVDIASRIGLDGVALDDPAETFHEASRLAPTTAAARLAGSFRLAADPLLRVSAARSSRRNPELPLLPLDRGAALRMSLDEALRCRASTPPTAASSISLGAVSTLLASAYGCRQRSGRTTRPVPSAGGLYPLELYVVATRVDGLAAGVHHYDPFAHRLETLDVADPVARLSRGLVDPDLAACAAATLVVTAVFPRTRFKYGQRGHRFALLEAGHLVQNLLLAATALGIAALPYGGFYDRSLDALVGADGLDECTVYVVFLGRPA